MNAKKVKLVDKLALIAGRKSAHSHKPEHSPEAVSTPILQKLYLHKLSAPYLILSGLLLLLILVALFFLGGSSQNDNDQILEQATVTLSQFSASVQSMRRVLEDDEIQTRAASVIADPLQ